MNKRITANVAKRRANSPQAIEMRRWLMELAAGKREYEALKEGRLSPFVISIPEPPSQNVLTRNYTPPHLPKDNPLLARNWKKPPAKL